jgi:hypothetical protein
LIAEERAFLQSLIVSNTANEPVGTRILLKPAAGGSVWIGARIAEAW